MNQSGRAVALFVALLLAVTTIAAAQTSTDQKESFFAEVVKDDLAIEVELAGTFVAEDKEELRIEPKSYRGDLIVTYLAAEGSSVKEGDRLMEFDPSSLKRSLEDARNTVSDKEIALAKAEADVKAFLIERDDKLSRSQKELELAEQDLQKALEQIAIELEDKEKQIKDAANRLADAKVDFEQLTQLYVERELHSATENILIDREKRRVQDLERGLEKTKKEVALWKKYDKDKASQEKQLEVNKKKAEMKKSEITLAVEMQEKEAEVEKARRELEKAQREVSELEEDAGSLTVISPRDGIVFYGTIGGGNSLGDNVFIVGLGGSSREMRVGGRVRTHQILMTVASMDRLSVQMKVLENEIQHMKSGLPITLRPEAFPSLVIKGELTKVDKIASRGGLFSEIREFSVSAEYEGVFPQLRSGMNCRVTVHADRIPDAVQVPVLAVFRESGDFYCLLKSGSSTKRRQVKLGATNGTMVEITEGLRPGETVALWDPSEE